MTRQNEPTYVIVFNYQMIMGHGRQFWSGRRWVHEYPDAEIYTDYSRARRALAIARHKASTAYSVDLVENYDLESERIALR